MKISLVGKGKLNSVIEEMAIKEGHTIVGKYGSDTVLKPDLFSEADIIIEATHREAFLKNIDVLLTSKKPIVVGTTGWNNEEAKVRDRVLRNGSGMLIAANFSLGVNIFFRLVRQASRLLESFEHFDVSLSEVHHNSKVDYPSGTALKAAEEILAQMPRKKQIITDANLLEIGNPSQLLISSMRLGKVFGIHRFHADSEFDSIEISHQAKNRIGFAQGAIEVAKWMSREQGGKKGFYTIDDYIDDILNKKSRHDDLAEDASFRR
ncbi:MAG: 4-hydroxy-tetrahydrodipicolinate reductase [Chloroherpetonaceae bacterium]|nr:4-hydroxy-tetrahydrodipicolinate reductase [Chloroherpetonaceae bacterium]